MTGKKDWKKMSDKEFIDFIQSCPKEEFSKLLVQTEFTDYGDEVMRRNIDYVETLSPGIKKMLESENKHLSRKK